MVARDTYGWQGIPVDAREYSWMPDIPMDARVNNKIVK